MQAIAYHLEARTLFHFGKRGVGIEATEVYGPSDTLFSALCNTLRETAGLARLEEMLIAFLSDPPFLLSGAFPYARLADDSVLRFYPRPLGAPPGYGSLDDLRVLKPVRFVSEATFCDWVNGVQPSPGCFLQRGIIWATDEEVGALADDLPRDEKALPLIWAEDDVPRVTVDRATNASEVYQAGRVRYAKRCGLWVAVVWRDPETWQSDTETALFVLGDAGLGGERSIGHGQYKLNFEECVALDLPDVGLRFVTLSHYWPQHEEIGANLMGEGAAYELLTRCGWIYSPDERGLSRLAVRMLSAGSVLNAAGASTYGGLADVTPGVMTAHNVYRYGYALPVSLAY